MKNIGEKTNIIQVKVKTPKVSNPSNNGNEETSSNDKRSNLMSLIENQKYDQRKTNKELRKLSVEKEKGFIVIVVAPSELTNSSIKPR